MPTFINWYECDHCGEQYDSYSEAEQCEWKHEYAKERAS